MKRCCVLIAYWNAGDALVRSLESLDARELIDVVVVDDGSTRHPAATVLEGAIPTDINVRLIELPEHRGVEHAANAGLEAIGTSYEYVARLDCGDLCINDRIAKQIAFLDAHPNCALVGAWAEFVSITGTYLYTHRHPVDSAAIRRQMFVNCAFTQPAVMFRSAIIEDVGFYPTDRPAAEDYAFFMRVLDRYPVANMPEPLLRYIVDPSSISSVRRRQQLTSRTRILLEHFEWKPIAVYGLSRTFLQLVISPRALSVLLNRAAEVIKNLRRALRRKDSSALGAASRD